MTHPPGPRWTAREDLFLRSYYGDLTAAECAALLPLRTREAVSHRAKRLQLAADRWALRPKPDYENYSKPESDRPHEAARRRCLKCGGGFKSTWIGNRICKNCARTNENVSPLENEEARWRPERVQTLPGQS